MHMNRKLLTAALLSGLVVAHRGGQQIPARIAAPIVEDFEGGNGKRRKSTSKRSTAAADKRAARKRRNIRARASKRHA